MMGYPHGSPSPRHASGTRGPPPIVLGTYRLLLAVLVALSHVGFRIHDLNPGVTAVVGFYLVSGYVMTGLIRTHYSVAGRISGFYVDRVLRLYPHYFAVAGIALAWFLYTGSRTDFLRVTPGVFNFVTNLTVVPLNYNMFINTREFTLIPPAWSLGAEIQYYLLMPFILIFGLRGVVLALSILVYICASFGLIHTDWFGYRLLPGVLFMFMLGSLQFDLHHGDGHGAPGFGNRTLVIAVLACAATLAGALSLGGKISLPYNRETLMGLALGVVALELLANRPRHKWDERLGNLSYGVFLNHFFVMWAFFNGRVEGPLATAAYLAISALLALALYATIEAPVLSMRRRLRTGSQRMPAAGERQAA